LKRTDALQGAQERFWHEVWRLEGGECLIAKTRPEHRCEGRVDVHHVCRKGWLRANGFDDATWDPGNGVLLCRAFHDLVSTRMRLIYLEELPARCVDFARAHGIEWRLEHECPSLTKDPA
jgi:hypothetical protein